MTSSMPPYVPTHANTHSILFQLTWRSGGSKMASVNSLPSRDRLLFGRSPMYFNMAVKLSQARVDNSSLPIKRGHRHEQVYSCRHGQVCSYRQGHVRRYRHDRSVSKDMGRSAAVYMRRSVSIDMDRSVCLLWRHRAIWGG